MMERQIEMTSAKSVDEGDVLMEAVGQINVQPTERPPLWRRIDLKWVIIGLCVAIVAYLAVMPLGFLLWQSFFTPQTANKAARFTWGTTLQAYTSSETLRLSGQLAEVRDRAPPLLLRRRHRARVDERAHQHAVQDAVLRPVDHPAHHSRHPLHGRVDPAGEPEDRHHQPGAEGLARARAPRCSTSTRSGA